MASVKITALYDPDPDESDEDDRTGLSEVGHEQLMNALMDAGLYDIDIKKA